MTFEANTESLDTQITNDLVQRLNRYSSSKPKQEEGNYLTIHGAKISYNNEALGTFWDIMTCKTYLQLDVEKTVAKFNSASKDECITYANSLMSKAEGCLSLINYYPKDYEHVSGYKIKTVKNTVDLMKGVLDALRGTQ